MAADESLEFVGNSTVDRLAVARVSGDSWLFKSIGFAGASRDAQEYALGILDTGLDLYCTAHPERLYDTSSLDRGNGRRLLRAFRAQSGLLARVGYETVPSSFTLK